MPISPSFSLPASSSYDPDSPVTTTLMGQIVDNESFLQQWIGTTTNAAVNHAHKGAATDGTAQIAFSDITGTIPTPKGFVNSQDVAVPKGGSDGTYDSGALTGSMTPVLCNVTISARRSDGGGYTDYYSWGVAKGTGGTDSYFIGQINYTASGLGYPELISGTGKVGQAPGNSGNLDITVTQFTSSGIKFNLPADVVAGNDLAYKVCISVVGY
jgi:hypothetical protein